MCDECIIQWYMCNQPCCTYCRTELNEYDINKVIALILHFSLSVLSRIIVITVNTCFLESQIQGVLMELLMRLPIRTKGFGRIVMNNVHLQWGRIPSANSNLYMKWSGALQCECKAKFTHTDDGVLMLMFTDGYHELDTSKFEGQMTEKELNYWLSH